MNVAMSNTYFSYYIMRRMHKKRAIALFYKIMRSKFSN